MGELSIFNLSEFTDKYNCKTYVETGTGIGDCLQHALKYNFKQYHSIDLDGDLIENAKKKFSQENVNLIHNYSTEALKELCPVLPKEESVLFFLDAHFPGADFHKMSYEESMTEFKEQAFPLLGEIQVIKETRDIKKDCFIIDDWKLYDDSNSYEMPGWKYKDIQDNLGLTTDSTEILNEFKETHIHEVKFRHQGFLFLYPEGN